MEKCNVYTGRGNAHPFAHHEFRVVLLGYALRGANGGEVYLITTMWPKCTTTSFPPTTNGIFEENRVRLDPVMDNISACLSPCPRIVGLN